MKHGPSGGVQLVQQDMWLILAGVSQPLPVGAFLVANVIRQKEAPGGLASLGLTIT